MEKKFNFIALSALGVAMIFIGLSGWLWFRLEDQRSEMELMKKEMKQSQELEKQKKEISQKTRETGQKPRVTHSTARENNKAAGVSPVETEASQAVQPQEKGKGDFFKQMREFMKNPEMAEMMQQRARRWIENQYGPLMEELGLTPEEKEAVIALLVETQQATQTKGMALMEGEGRDAALQEIREETKQAEERLKNLLGGERFAKFDEYQKTLGARMAVKEFKNKMNNAQTPLEDNQLNQLSQIMFEEDKKDPSGLSRDNIMQDPAKYLSEDGITTAIQAQQEKYQRVVNQASSFLNADQIQALSAFFNNKLEGAERGMKMGAKFFEQMK